MGAFLGAFGNSSDEYRCDLLKTDCSLNGVSISLKDKNVKPMSENTLILQGQIISPNIKIKGIQMDMGDMPVKIAQLSDGGYEFKFIPSMCMMHSMSYEIFLYSGVNLLGRIGEFTVYH